MKKKKNKTFTLEQINLAMIKLGLGPAVIMKFLTALNAARGLGIVEKETKLKTFKDLVEAGEYEVSGVKGMNSKRFKKSFKTAEAREKWIEKNEDDIDELKFRGPARESARLDEGSGKSFFNFQGTDEIGDFWVVTNPTGIEVLEDILYQANIFDMILQHRGGLDMSTVALITKSKAKAKKLAGKLIG
jgi:hypothetical protein